MTTPQEDEQYSRDVDEMLDMLIELSAVRWQSNNFSSSYLRVHIKKLCELFASKAKRDVLTALKTQTDEQKKEQKEGPQAPVERGAKTSPQSARK